MKVLVDTSVWSLALRRPQPTGEPAVGELAELVREFRMQVLGAVRQELLSGIRSPQQFETLRVQLRSFPDLPLAPDDYELAAEFFNRCRRRGVQGSNTDFLICAAAHRHDLAIFTTDGDFGLFREHLPIRLHEPRRGTTSSTAA
ncbi:MAG: type II toxin-antitoxin system VapC family toxin [Deferrisomatales bacterium]